MATDRYPNRNVNYPFTEEELATVRARIVPGGEDVLITSTAPAPSDGKGSRREARKGEWIDDRVIVLGGPSSPSKDSPPELKKKSEKALPTFVDTKAYQVTLSKGVVVDGRMLGPGKEYVMAGYVCTPITASIFEAVELGDVPHDPDISPSDDVSQPETKKKVR